MGPILELLTPRICWYASDMRQSINRALATVLLILLPAAVAEAGVPISRRSSSITPRVRHATMIGNLLISYIQFLLPNPRAGAHCTNVGMEMEVRPRQDGI